MLRRLPVSNSADFEVSAERLWEAISEPGNLNDSHPFCDSNEVISWEDEGSLGPAGLPEWLELRQEVQDLGGGGSVGYTLVIGEERWSAVLRGMGDSAARGGTGLDSPSPSTPHILARLPRLLALVPHAIWVRPMSR